MSNDAYPMLTRTDDGSIAINLRDTHGVDVYTDELPHGRFNMLRVGFLDGTELVIGLSKNPTVLVKDLTQIIIQDGLDLFGEHKPRPPEQI